MGVTAGGCAGSGASAKFPEPRADDQVLDILQGEELAARRQRQLFHVIAPRLEATAGDAKNMQSFHTVCMVYSQK
jgi:hypothetical protein